MNTLFQYVLTASFHGSIVILAVLLLRLLLGKAAPKKYLCYLWVLAGLRLLMPFDIQSQFSLQPQLPQNAIVRWEQPASMFQPEQTDAAEQPDMPDLSASALKTDLWDHQEQEAPTEPAAPPVEREAPVSRTAKTSWSAALLPMVWAAVAVSFFLYNLYCYFTLRKKVLGARKIPGGWEADNIETAFILGFVKPQIYIPTKTPTQDRNYILAHERTHLDKGDHWIKMLGFLTLAIHWFNPLVWLAYALLCKDIEMACDERVVQFMELQERKEYSTALLNCSSHHVLHAASPVAFGEVNVKNRIQSILSYRNPSFWAGLLSVMAVAFVTVCLVTNPINSGSGLFQHSGEFTEATQPPMEENPDWGLRIFTDATSCTSTTVYYKGDPAYASETMPITVSGEIPRTLDVWNGKAWEPLTPKVDPLPVNTDHAYSLRIFMEEGFYNRETIDWQESYGKLSEGDYRISLPVYRGEEMQTHYAWFHIYANALTGDEAEAFARVEAALYRLSHSQHYFATISESSSQGALLPTATIRVDGSSAQIDYYTGEYCYSSLPCDPSNNRVATWLDAFHAGENTHISFSGKDGKYKGNEICFTSSWVDLSGKVYHKTHTYVLDEMDQIISISLLTQSAGEDGVITQSLRTVAVEYSGNYAFDIDATPEAPDEAMENSPWDLYFAIDPHTLTPSGCHVDFHLGYDHIGLTNFTTDGSYWLERYTPSSNQTKQWFPLLSQSDNPHWSEETYRVKNRSTDIEVDWTAYYGELSPGLYRMGKRFYDGNSSIPQYAQFQVYPAGAILGEGGQEAMDRISAAIEEVCSGNYCIKSTTYSDNPLYGGTTEYVFWKYGDICVADQNAYSGEGLRRGLPIRRGDEEDGRIDSSVNPHAFFNGWAKGLPWNQLNYRVYFPQGDSRISQKEISFTGDFFSRYSSLCHYSVFFDEAGKLQSIERRYQDYLGGTNASVLSVEQVPEEEIQAVIEEALEKEAQQPSNNT